jgi:hypothetical protein
MKILAGLRSGWLPILKYLGEPWKTIFNAAFKGYRV